MHQITNIEYQSVCKFYRHKFLTELLELHAINWCGLGNSGTVMCTKLQKLDVCNNKNFNDINFLTELLELDASDECGLSHDGFRMCTKINTLDISGNAKVTNINFLPELRKLSAMFGSGLSNDGFRSCTKICDLSLVGNNNIGDLNFLPELTLLGGNDILDDYSFQSCTKLQKLCLSHRNTHITNLNFLSELEWLSVDSFYSGISNNSIRNCTKLKTLYVSDNPNITDVNFLLNLTELDASFRCGLVPDGIAHCTNLQNIYVSGNNAFE